MKKIFLLTLAMFALVILSGCATTGSVRFHSNVDSLASPDALGKKSYVLLPGNQGVEEGDLQFQEFASYVDRVMAERGFVKVGSFDSADIAVFFTYAIGDPQTHQYTYSVPVWGKTGTSSSTTRGTVSTYGNSSTYSGTTTHTPSYGVVGSSTHLGTYTNHSRFLVLDAYDIAVYKESNRMSQIWKTSVVSTGSSNDLRLVMPYMVTSMKQYIGINTGRKIEVVLPENDPAVINIRAISQP